METDSTTYTLARAVFESSERFTVQIHARFVNTTSDMVYLRRICDRGESPAMYLDRADGDTNAVYWNLHECAFGVPPRPPIAVAPGQGHSEVLRLQASRQHPAAATGRREFAIEQLTGSFRLWFDARRNGSLTADAPQIERPARTSGVFTLKAPD